MSFDFEIRNDSHLETSFIEYKTRLKKLDYVSRRTEFLQTSETEDLEQEIVQSFEEINRLEKDYKNLFTITEQF